MADTVSLRKRLGEFGAFEKRNLVSRTEWGNIDFSRAATDIDSVFEIVAFLNDLPIERLPQNAANQIESSLAGALAWVKRIDTFTLEGNPAGNRDEIIQNLAAHQQEMYTQSHLWIPFLAYLKGDIPDQLKSIAGSVQSAKGGDASFQEYLTSQRQIIDGIVAATREASADAGVSQFTQDFENEATNRTTEAATWLNRAAGSAVTTLVVVALYTLLEPPSATAALVQFVTSKVILLAVLIAVTAWCAGNYKANMHQATMNRHKAHSLKTFRAFVAAADDPSVRDAVLMETTRSIFNHGSSGYLPNDAGSGDGPSKIIEIVKGSAEKAG